MGRLHGALWTKALERLLDDELDARRTGRVLDHLDVCPPCLAALAELTRMQWSLAGMATAGNGPIP